MLLYSTDLCNLRSHKPHGQVEFSLLEEGVVIYQATGPFNLELVKAFGEIEQEILKEFKSNSSVWCGVVKFNVSCIVLEEAFEAFVSYIKSLKDNGTAALAAAFVFPDGVEGSRMMKPLFRKCYEGSGYIYEDFNELENAVEWARSKLIEYRN